MNPPQQQSMKGGSLKSLEFSELKGGSGSASGVMSALGGIGEQSGTHGNAGVIAPKMSGGDPTLTQMAVPAALVMASQFASSLKLKQGGNPKQDGGIGITDVAVPAVLVLASNVFGNGSRTTRKMRGGEEPPVVVSDDMGSSTIVPAKVDGYGDMSKTEGGSVPMIIPAGLLLTNTLAPKMLGRRVSYKSSRKMRNRKSNRRFRKQKK